MKNSKQTLNEQIQWDDVPHPQKKGELVLKIVLENAYKVSINNTD
jgi:hypothetical protein